MDVGLDPLPHCGRIDVHIYAPSLKEEAHWLRLVTREIDWVRGEGGREGGTDRPTNLQLHIIIMLIYKYVAASRGVPWTLGLISATESRNFCPLQ